MAQLIVRNIENAVARKLRARAAAAGVSVEEAHRRLLRDALLKGGLPSGKNFIEYLEMMPAPDGVEFERSRDLPREIDL